MLSEENSTLRILALFWLSTTTQSVMMAHILSVPSVNWTNWINNSCNSAVWIWNRASGNNCIILCRIPRHLRILSPIISRSKFPTFWRRNNERLRLISLTSKVCIPFSTTCCSDPLEGGGTIYSNGFFFFFVQWIFADRYIHRRELRVVSLESSSSVEYGIKKIFLIFVFYRELSRFKVLWK